MTVFSEYLLFYYNQFGTTAYVEDFAKQNIILCIIFLILKTKRGGK